MDSIELLIIGAGWHGLAMAKTYLDVTPLAKVVLYDAAASIGGVWAKERLYPGLRTNNLFGTYEYSDYPMNPSLFDVTPGQHIPGYVVHQYLVSYAEHFHLTQRIKLKIRVNSIEHLEFGGWLVMATDLNKTRPQNFTVTAKKLVVATGLTSQPFIPNLKGSKRYEAPILHNKSFCEEANSLSRLERVTVLGGAKSAWDVVYALASKGVEVDWIIRESGHGPVWMAPSHVTPLKLRIEKLLHTRFLTWMSPCIWGCADGYGSIRRLLHGTAFGRFLVRSFWAILQQDVSSTNNYAGHAETAKLQPWVGAFWTASSLSILNYPTDFLEFVRDGSISIHIADVDHLDRHTVKLSDGQSLRSEALVCCTGWQKSPPIEFLPKGIEGDIGIPHLYTELRSKSLEEKADADILDQFPILRRQPTLNQKLKPLTATDGISAPSKDITPYQLYRFMVPSKYWLLSQRDLAFAGAVMSASTALIAQSQALWITSYLSGQLNKPFETSSPSEILYEAVLHSRYGRWRYSGGFGSRCPDFAFDALPYLDLLHSDLGIRSHRKTGALAEIFQAYSPRDFTGLIEEWQSSHKAVS